METTTSRNLPLSLVIVALLFILGGISAVIEVVLALMNDHLNINFGVLGIPIGIGLLRLRRGWRALALVFIWIGLIACPIIGGLFLWNSGPLDFTVFGQKNGNVPKVFGVALVVGFFVFLVWEYRVLTRRDVRRLFFG